jgi:hypothetical protein
LGFKENEMTLFLKNVKELMPKYKFPPTHVYNIDESGLLAVQEPGLILTLKGQKRVSSVTWLERGKNCSFCTASAAGIFLPLIFIYLLQQRMA